MSTTKLTKKVKSGSTVAPENFFNPHVSKRINGLSPSDHWFDCNLRALLGGEVTLVRHGVQEQIDRKGILEWVSKHL